MRKTTGAIVCPSCERIIDASEPRCPYCGAWRPGLFGFGPALQKAIGGSLDLNNAITGACVVLYVLSLALDPAALLHFNGLFSILSPSTVALVRLGMTGSEIVGRGHWWTLATAVFLHGGILHILFNLVIMRRYLPMVVDLYGNVRSFVIFMISGIAGFVLSVGLGFFFGGSLSIGASGSIFGLLGALISYGRRTGQSHITNQLWTMAVVMFVMGFFMGHVDVWAHAGGFIGGFACAEVMPTSHRREGPLEFALAGGLALVTVAGFVLSLLTAGALVGG